MRRLAGYAAMSSAILALPMVATLIAMYALIVLGQTPAALKVGNVNDWLHLPVYGLLLPVVPVLHVALRETGETRSLVLATVGATGIVITLVLQWLLVSGRISFEKQVAFVGVSLLAVGVWMIGTGYLGRKTGLLPTGLRDGLLGAAYFGVPIWGLSISRRLLHGDR